MARGKKAGRGRRKKITVDINVERNDANKDDSYTRFTRRSSMRVNLSYVSNLSDSEPSSSRKSSNENAETLSRESPVQNDVPVSAEKSKQPDDTATPASTANVTVINNGNCFPSNAKTPEEEIQSNSLLVIKEKEQRLNKSCMRLKNAIMNKTQALFDKENELAIKTTEVLASSCSPSCSTSKSNEVNEIDEISDKRSPSIRVNIGKNDQIIMSGDGKKRNPVQVNSMGNCDSPESENIPSEKVNEDSMDCNQSIASTPKKSRTESYLNNKEESGKTSETMLRIPVARLFADDNDPNNSMSEVNPLHSVNTSKKSDHEISNNNVSNISRLSNELNYSTSPILSQGTRRSRLSRLSLKKKLTTSVSQTSKISSTAANESFINKMPITCSSFIEKQDKTNSKNKIGENCEIIELDDKSKSDNSCKTINLDDNNSNKTINIENSSNDSCMEITTIPSHMPIIRRSFQELIRTSLKLENVALHNDTISTQRKTLIANKSKDSNKEKNDSESNQAHSDEICREDCSINTVRTSLNVNTSLDRVNSEDNVLQKENEIPNKSKETVNKKAKQVEEDDTIIIQRQSICNIRSSMQVNTSLDSVRKSSVPKLNDGQKNSNKRISQPSSEKLENSDTIIKQLNNDVNLEKGSSDAISSRPSTSTVRSSMQVNTSLDSARKSPIVKNVLDFNKILSMVQETSTNSNQSKDSVYTSNDKSSDDESELENMSLMERIRNISATKKSNKKINQSASCSTKSTEDKNSTTSSSKKSIETANTNSDTSTKSTEVTNVSSNTRRKSVGIDIPNEIRNKSNRVENISLSKKRKSDETENSKLITPSKLNRVENTGAKKRKRSVEIETSNSSTRKSGAENANSTSESSIIEATPYPTSRSVLLKTMIKNNIAMNTLDPRKFVDLSDNEDSNDELGTKSITSPNKYQSVYARKKAMSPSSMDTVVLDSSDDLSSESEKEKEPVIIDESMNETKGNNEMKINKKTDENKNFKPTKRKLYPLRDNSQLISFSPSEIQVPIAEVEPQITKRKTLRNLTQKKKQENKEVPKSPEPIEECEPIENKALLKKVKKTKKKPRKIVSKKIVVKKVTNTTILDNYMNNEEEPTPRLSERNSLREFDLRRIKNRRKENSRKNHRIVIVVTGLGKEDKDLVKSVIKALGSATLEANVTPRTTHVVSSGVRTINLLKGIIRGCWLLTMEWALKSLESQKWLDPSPYEMSHFSKAVQENRRDRQLFGKAYIPELFVTCGFIYVENGTSPPSSTLKELIKISGGQITEDPDKAEIIIGSEGLKEIWVLDSITTGEVQLVDQYKRS